MEAGSVNLLRLIKLRGITNDKGVYVLYGLKIKSSDRKTSNTNVDFLTLLHICMVCYVPIEAPCYCIYS